MKVVISFANTVKVTHKPVNFLIRWLDKAIAGHLAIALETDYSNNIYEAVAPKTRKLTFKKWLSYYKPVRQLEIPVPKNKELEVLEWLESTLGVRYGYEQIILIALCAIPYFDKLLAKVNINYKRALICTELGSRFVDKFLVYQLKEPHDKIGVKDMEIVCDDLQLSEIKWQ